MRFVIAWRFLPMRRSYAKVSFYQPCMVSLGYDRRYLLIAHVLTFYPIPTSRTENLTRQKSSRPATSRLRLIGSSCPSPKITKSVRAKAKSKVKRHTYRQHSRISKQREASEQRRQDAELSLANKIDVARARQSIHQGSPATTTDTKPMRASPSQ